MERYLQGHDEQALALHSKSQAVLPQTYGNVPNKVNVNSYEIRKQSLQDLRGNPNHIQMNNKQAKFKNQVQYSSEMMSS